MDACRDWGQTPEYWWSHLTLDRLRAMRKSLRQRPTLEMLAAAYLQYEAPAEDGPATELPEPMPLYEP
jgi:hypothetical protein